MARVSQGRVSVRRLSLAGDRPAELGAPLSTAFASVRQRALGTDVCTALICSGVSSLIFG